MPDLTLTLEANENIGRMMLELARIEADLHGKAKQVELAMAETALPIVKAYTPIITTSWRSSWFVANLNQQTAIEISPLAQNPLSDEDPWEYGPKVHEMGGYSQSGHERAVLDVVVRDFSEVILDQGEEFVMSLAVFKS